MTIIQWLVLGAAIFGIVWYIWYVGFHLPNLVEKMSSEDREKFIRDWNEAGKYDR
jgi:hypothetical protein